MAAPFDLNASEATSEDDTPSVMQQPPRPALEEPPRVQQKASRPHLPEQLSPIHCLNRVDKAKIGSRIWIFWEGDKEWYAGVVESAARGEDGKFRIQYIDGEVQWEDLRVHHFLTATNAPAAEPQRLPFDLNIDPESDEETLVDGIRIFESSEDPQGLPAIHAINVEGKVRVGSDIWIFWEGDEAWFRGVVEGGPRGIDGRFLVHYDDGDVFWEDLGKQHFLVLEFQCVSLKLARPIPTLDLTVEDSETDSDDDVPLSRKQLHVQKMLKRELQWVKDPLWLEGMGYRASKKRRTSMYLQTTTCPHTLAYVNNSLHCSVCQFRFHTALKEWVSPYDMEIFEK